MGYHIRTYDLEPHAITEAERRLADACAAGIASAFLAASFHTEIGPLNQVIQIWTDALPAAAADAAIEDLVDERQSNEFVPFAVSPRIVPGSVGPFFEELRTTVRETGLWPPLAAAQTLGLEPFEFIRMENKIVMQAAFSSLTQGESCLADRDPPRRRKPASRQAPKPRQVVRRTVTCSTHSIP